MIVASAAKSNDLIIKELQQQGILSKGEVLNKKIMAGGKRAKEVILLTDPNKGDLALKIFDDLKKYNSELSEFAESLKIVEKINKLNNSKTIPAIIMPIDFAEVINYGVIILPQAKGRTLEEIIANLKELDDNEVKNIFYNIGEQIGNLDALLIKQNNGYILIHPDSHADNFMYDNKQNKLYWIDTSNIYLKKEANVSLERNTFVAGIARGIFGALKKYYLDIIDKEPQQEIKAIINSIEKHLLALKNLFKGYQKATQGIIDAASNYQIFLQEDTFRYSNSLNKITIVDFIKNLNTSLAKRNLNIIDLNKYESLSD